MSLGWPFPELRDKAGERRDVAGKLRDKAGELRGNAGERRNNGEKSIFKYDFGVIHTRKDS